MQTIFGAVPSSKPVLSHWCMSFLVVLFRLRCQELGKVSSQNKPLFIAFGKYLGSIDQSVSKDGTDVNKYKIHVLYRKRKQFKLMSFTFLTFLCLHVDAVGWDSYKLAIAIKMGGNKSTGSIFSHRGLHTLLDSSVPA